MNILEMMGKTSKDGKKIEKKILSVGNEVLKMIEDLKKIIKSNKSNKEELAVKQGRKIYSKMAANSLELGLFINKLEDDKEINKLFDIAFFSLGSLNFFTDKLVKIIKSK